MPGSACGSGIKGYGIIQGVQVSLLAQQAPG